MTASPPGPIPLDVQLDAACTLELRKVRELLGPHGFHWHPDASTSRISDYRHLFTFSRGELLSYLERQPARCEELLMHSYDQRGSPNTFMEEHNGRYRVGWCDERGNLSETEEFDSFAEAAADYVLFTLRLGRLRS